MTQKETNDPRTYAIIGAAMQVHRELGCGFLESVYHEALAIEFERKGVPFVAEVELPITYGGQRLSTCFRADFVCYEQVIVELKALAALSGSEEAQVINYLKATGHQLGLLINFGASSLQYHRYLYSNKSIQSA